MRKFQKSLLYGLALVSALVCMCMPQILMADTTNYPLTVQTSIIPFHISGQYTATTAGVVRFQLPYAARLINVAASARASGGTSPTLTVDVLRGGTTVLSAPITVTAGAVSEATAITNPNLPDESIITANLNIGGTTPTWNDITLLLTVVRR